MTNVATDLISVYQERFNYFALHCECFNKGKIEEESNLQKMQISSSDKPFMGLSTFSGDQATKKDIGVAKNYLTEDKLQNLNMLASGYFDIAELRTVCLIFTARQDFIEQLDQVLAIAGSPVLMAQERGAISRQWSRLKKSIGNTK